MNTCERVRCGRKRRLQTIQRIGSALFALGLLLFSSGCGAPSCEDAIRAGDKIDARYQEFLSSGSQDEQRRIKFEADLAKAIGEVQRACEFE